MLPAALNLVKFLTHHDVALPQKISVHIYGGTIVLYYHILDSIHVSSSILPRNINDIGLIQDS